MLPNPPVSVPSSGRPICDTTFVDFRERREDQARLIHEARAFGQAGADGQRAARPDRAFVEVRQEFGADDSAQAEIGRTQQRGDADADRAPTDVRWPSAATAGSRSVRNVISGLSRSVTPLRKNSAARAPERRGSRTSSRPSSANATVHAIGRNSRPSTRCSVKIGMYAVMMIAMA